MLILWEGEEQKEEEEKYVSHGAEIRLVAWAIIDESTISLSVIVNNSITTTATFVIPSARARIHARTRLHIPTRSMLNTGL